MKKIFAVIVIMAITLCGCAKTVETTPDEATYDEATVDETARGVTEPPTEVPTEPPTEPPTLDELALTRYEDILSREAQGSAELGVEELYQLPELPSGCESVALTIAVNHFGYELAKTDIADDYLVYGNNFATSFVGNPYHYGGSGIYPPGMLTTVWNMVEDIGAALYPFDTTGLSIEELYRFLDADCPVLIWTTVYMNWPYFESGTEYEGIYYPWYDLEHCVCMYGYDEEENEIMISDPERGKITVDATRFADIYDEIGRFSMILMDSSDLK